MTTAKVKQAAAPKKAVKQIEDAVAAGAETIETVVNAATQGYEKAAGLTKDQVEAAVKAQTQAFKSYEDTVQIAKENVDAVVKSGTILTKGMQDLTKEVMTLTQAAIEDTVAASKQMMAAKTIRELVDLQTTTCQSVLDKLIAEGSRLSDQSVKLIEEAVAPLTDRVNATVDKMVKSAA